MNTRTWKEFTAVLLAVVLGAGWLGCRAETHGEAAHEATEHDGEHEEGHGDEGEHEEAIQLTEAQMSEFGIELAEAGPATLETFVELPGEVRPNADRLAHLVPRFEGIVTDVRKRVGDAVKKGDILAVVESSESLANYQLKTLIDGTVIEKHITRGEAISRDTAAFVVADLDTVWVDLSVYQRHLNQIKVGQPVLISAGPGLPDAHGVISYVTQVVDEETRTATARAVLPNPDGAWRPGVFVTGMVTVETTDAEIAVPPAALQTVGTKRVVFVHDDDGLEARSVTLGRSDRFWVEVLEGLALGDRYVSQGSFILKSELEKGAFEAGHGH